MKFSRRSLLAVGVLLGALFFYLAGRAVDWSKLGATLKVASPTAIGGIVVCVYLNLVVKAWRWRYLVRPLTATSTKDLLPAVYAGNIGNLIVPHAGEIVRAIAAQHRLNVPASALLASIAVERIFDAVALLLLALVALIPVGRMSPDLLVASFVIGGLAAIFLGAAAALVLWNEHCIRFVGSMLTPLPARLREKVLRQIDAGTAGFHSILRPALFLPVLLLSLAQWIAILGCIGLGIVSVGVPVSLASAVAVLLLGVIGLTLPAAPGHVGTVQLAFTVALAPFGVAHSDAFAASLIYNVTMVIIGFALGLRSLHQAGTEMSRLLQSAGPTEPRA